MMLALALALALALMADGRRNATARLPSFIVRARIRSNAGQGRCVMTVNALYLRGREIN
ncbi:TPA: hypothetical protein G9F11_004401 [Salmonella enterica]|uniref:Uncharacterized protein n=1 Tax=Salmonella enterica TaxID=28901 RepID=A0A750HQC9_SALER|nr:hypothetical protein [Salmonella enterica]HDI1195956.1 hypothetical protein [Salmonella enterica]